MGLSCLPPKRSGEEESKCSLEYLDFEDDRVSHYKFEVAGYELSELG